MATEPVGFRAACGWPKLVIALAAKASLARARGKHFALSLADIIDYDLAMRGREQFLRTSARTGVAAMRHQRAAKNASRNGRFHPAQSPLAAYPCGRAAVCPALSSIAVEPLAM